MLDSVFNDWIYKPDENFLAAIRTSSIIYEADITMQEHRHGDIRSKFYGQHINTPAININLGIFSIRSTPEHYLDGGKLKSFPHVLEVTVDKPGKTKFANREEKISI